MKNRRVWRFKEGGSMAFDRKQLRFTLDEKKLPIEQYEVIVFLHLK